MQLRIPLVPFAIRFERRSPEPLRPRLSVRAVIALVAVVAITMGMYVTLVVRPDRRLRYQRADEAIRQQIALFLRAADEASQQERSVRDLEEKDKASAEQEDREAAECPESSEEHRSHQGRARSWRKAARDQRGLADRARVRAQAFRQGAAELLESQWKLESSLEEIERMAARAAQVPKTLGSLAELKRRIAQESDKVGGTSRAALVQATAIWKASEFLRQTKQHPAPEKLKASACMIYKDNDYMWEVSFSDPKTGKAYGANVYFSEPVVREFLARRR